MSKLVFISRHEPTIGQIETAKIMGFDGIERKEVIFGDNPVKQVREITNETQVAVVAPINVCLDLLRSGYTVIEFVNMPSARQRGVFVCKGGYKHTPLLSYFFECPIPIEEQEEVDII